MELTQDSLLTKLRQLECHFTWDLKTIELYELQSRLRYNNELSTGFEWKVFWSYNYLAYTKYTQNLLQEALDYLEQAENYIREHGGDIDERKLTVTYGNFAWVYYHRGDYTQSQSYLDKLVEIEFPFEPPSDLHPAVFGEKGWACLNSNDQYFEIARECFAKAFELEPEEIEWNEGYAVALYRTETDHTSLEESPATQQLRRVLELNPNNALIMALLGVKYADCRKHQRAQELLERAIELEPEKPYVIRHVAKFYRKNGRLDESISLLKRALEITPDASVLHHQIALSYGQKYESDADEYFLDLSIQHLKRAVSLKPTNIFAKLHLGRAYVSAEDYIKAEEMYERATEMAITKNQHRQIVAVRYANFLQYEKKDVPLAVRKYKEGLSLQKDTEYWEICARKLENIANNQIFRNSCDGKAFEILGYVNRMRGQTQQAIECYKKAILYDPENEQHLTTLNDLRLSMQ